jgi:hypothetical protein
VIKREEILHDISIIIDYRPDLIIRALKESGVSVKNELSRKELIDLVVDNLYDSKSFRDNISLTLSLFYAGEISLRTSDSISFSNITDEIQKWFTSGDVDKGDVAKHAASKTAKATMTGVQSGGVVGAIVGFVVGATDSIFYASGQKNQAEAEKESAKTDLYKKLLTPKEKKNQWIPIAVTGGVLLVGGIVAFIMLKK